MFCVQPGNGATACCWTNRPWVISRNLGSPPKTATIDDGYCGSVHQSNCLLPCVHVYITLSRWLIIHVYELIWQRRRKKRFWLAWLMCRWGWSWKPWISMGNGEQYIWHLDVWSAQLEKLVGRFQHGTFLASFPGLPRFYLSFALELFMFVSIFDDKVTNVDDKLPFWLW